MSVIDWSVAAAVLAALVAGLMLGRRWGYIAGFEAGRVQGGENARRHYERRARWAEEDSRAGETPRCP